MVVANSGKAIFGDFWIIDETATDVSGRDVPIATIVAPITRGEILILYENFSTNFNKKLEERIRSNKDIAKIK
jgi:hypothetical protein